MKCISREPQRASSAAAPPPPRRLSGSRGSVVRRPISNSLQRGPPLLRHGRACGSRRERAPPPLHPRKPNGSQHSVVRRPLRTQRVALVGCINPLITTTTTKSKVHLHSKSETQKTLLIWMRLEETYIDVGLLMCWV